MRVRARVCNKYIVSIYITVSVCQNCIAVASAKTHFICLYATLALFSKFDTQPIHNDTTGHMLCFYS